MTRLPPAPELTWKEDGTPIDARYGDIYFSRQDGLEETRTVFLSGCNLPEAWAGQHHYTIAELGFGTGLNFLAVWALWQAHRDKAAWLHFISFEGYPLQVEDVRQALSAWPELAPLAQRLCAAWPKRAQGVQHLVWPEQRLTLTLHIGQIEETLPRTNFTADAWFLDGFSPAKNEAMWAPSLWSRVAERSAPQARLATFTVAGHVRRGLQDAGFSVSKQAGYGRKRERLEATFKRSEAASLTPSTQNTRRQRIAVIGAGIAGACLAYRLHQFGHEVVVYEQADRPGAGASGNPLALVMPRLDASDTVQSRLLIEAYLAAQRFYLGRSGVSVCPTEQRARDRVEALRFEKLQHDPPLSRDQLEISDNGLTLHHKASLALQPLQVMDELLAPVTVRWGTQAVIDRHTKTVCGEAFDTLVFASGQSACAAFPELDLTARRGQVDWVRSSADTPARAYASGQYAVSQADIRLWGASFETETGQALTPSPTATQANWQGLLGLAPDWLSSLDRSKIEARVGIRATTADRLPLIGAVPDDQALRAMKATLERRKWQTDLDAPTRTGLYLAAGYGARGFTWAPWAANLLAAQISGFPVPTTTAIQLAVAPARQIIRRLKRGL